MLKTLFATLSAAALFATAAPMVALADHPLTIYNNADQAIEYVYISPVDSNVWGDDWLGPDTVLEPGDKMTFTIDSGCDQDIKVVFMDHHSSERRNFDTCQYDLRVNP
jgi:hypothetical protein